MGNLSISSNELLAVIGTGVGLITGIWHMAMYIGKLTVRQDLHQSKLDEHTRKLDEHDDELRYLKGIPQR